MSQPPQRRPARRPGPELPGGEFLLEPPPELAESVSGGIGQYLFYLPMIGGAGAMVFMYAGPGATPLTYAASAMYGLSSFGMVLSQVGRNSSDRARKADGDRRDYLRYLGQARRRIQDAARQQRAAQFWNHPDPDALWSYVPTSRCWERHGGDPDFTDVRIATGPQRLTVRLVPPETKPVEDLDPISAGALRRFVSTHTTVADLPIAVALRNYARVAFSGGPAEVRGLVRAMLAQAVTLHPPEELRLAVCADPARQRDWEWVKWLPHALHPSRVDAAGPLRLLRDDLGQIEALLGADLAERPRFRPGGTPDRAHLLVVVDGGRVPLGCQLAVGDALGVTVLDLAGVLGRDSDQHVLRLRVTGQDVSLVNPAPDGGKALVHIGVADTLNLNQVDALAHQLAPLRADPAARPGAVLASRFDLPELLGLGELATLDATESWQRRANRDRLRVPIGVNDAGGRVDLDIKEAAQGGMGPHGLVIGATGSGKSELLRTLVLGLAATHSPEQLNVVLADFKGGATFLGMEGLPHVSAVITNLAAELPLVDRMQDALRGELVRRQELLRAAGNLSSVLDYERARAQGAELEPLPNLLVVVDEFSELLTSKPEFAELFVMIGRLGRSLAVHLLLASQRLEEGRLRGLETHLSYRICLRTFSANESRLVLGVPDAHTLPSEPGHGYLKHDVTSMTRFKAAYVSGPYQQPQSAQRAEAVVRRHLVPYVAEEIAIRSEPADAEPAPSGPAAPAGDEPAGPRVLDLVINRLRGRGRPAHQIWLPPLSDPPSLGQLLGDLHHDPVRGLTADSSVRGRLAVPVGVIDLPFEQRRAPLRVDLAGAAGHVAVIGAPQSGKSTLLRSLVAALALTHTPREVQFYCLDFGGGALGTIAGLPHVGGVATRLQPDAVSRTVAEVNALLAARERRFARDGVDSMAAYRAALPADDPYGDVFLVVDGWGVLRSEFEALDAAITTLASRGLSYGIHVVVAANRWAELRPQLRDTLLTRLELRLGDPFESEINRYAAGNVPVGVPGRGLVRENLHFLGALPRLDPPDDDLATGVRTLVESVRATWPGQPAPAVRLLPTVLPYADLLAAIPTATTGVPIGLDSAQLRPVTVDFAQDPHLVVFGDGESGKSNLLRAIAAGLVRAHPPDQARLIVVDTRRTLLDAVAASHLIAFGHSAPVIAKIAADIREAMLQRVPGPDVPAEQLRSRSWWTGPELYVLVDDYDLLVSGAGSPLQPLLEVLPQSRDLGLHLVLARACGGAGRSLYEPVLQRLRDLGTPGVVLSGNPDEGPLVGDVAPQRMPPGRGRYHHRRQGTRLIQTPLCTDAPSPSRS